jgi:glycerol-3-phosphate acyltransferase PlsX
MAMRIVVDAMGSDTAPVPEVAGVVEGAKDFDGEVILVGDEALLQKELEQHPKRSNVRVVHASEAISMHDAPVNAVRQKKDSSLLVGLRLVKEGEADAFVSAGNTGAVMVGALTVLGKIKGVNRPAICQALPNATGRVTILDLGANASCTAHMLCEFAEMGMAYSQYMLGVEHPRVGLLNIGEEESKGHQVAKDVHRSLSAMQHVNFIGNVEPKAVFQGGADVVVCDGFIGNLFLKTSEAAAGFLGKLVREKFESSNMNKLGAVLARKALQELKATVDPNESHGAPLLGVNGVVLILHGSCNQNAVCNAIAGARHALDNRLNQHIGEFIQELRKFEASQEEGAASSEVSAEPDVTAGEGI